MCVHAQISRPSSTSGPSHPSLILFVRSSASMAGACSSTSMWSSLHKFIESERPSSWSSCADAQVHRNHGPPPPYAQAPTPSRSWSPWPSPPFPSWTSSPCSRVSPSGGGEVQWTTGAACDSAWSASNELLFLSWVVLCCRMDSPAESAVLARRPVSPPLLR